MMQLPLIDLPTANERNALDELFSRAETYRNSQAYVKLLQFIGKFSRYSPFNCFLLHMQNPEVTYVATPHQWRTRFGRSVKREARPLIILAPRSPVIFVYDLMDTEGRELPVQWRAPFETRGELTEHVWGIVLRNCLRDHLPVTPKKYSPLHAGSAIRLGSIMQAQDLNPYLKDPIDIEFTTQFIIEINQDLDLPSRYATLVHELGHIYCGHLGASQEKWWPDRRGMKQEQAKIEAESIAYLACRRRGLITKSDEYLAKYIGNDFMLPELSLDTVLRVVNQIEKMSEQILPERKATIITQQPP
jgi:hypothetical protein